MADQIPEPKINEEKHQLLEALRLKMLNALNSTVGQPLTPHTIKAIEHSVTAIMNEFTGAPVGAFKVTHNEDRISVEFDGELDPATGTIQIKAIAPDIGPNEPIDGLLTLTDEQFINRYKPETDEQGNYYRAREWYDVPDRQEILKAIDENRCWTVVDDDDGNPCIVWGNRTVNRLFNIITENPIENPDWEVQVPGEWEPDDDEECD